MKRKLEGDIVFAKDKKEWFVDRKETPTGDASVEHTRIFGWKERGIINAPNFVQSVMQLYNSGDEGRAAGEGYMPIIKQWLNIRR